MRSYSGASLTSPSGEMADDHRSASRLMVVAVLAWPRQPAVLPSVRPFELIIDFQLPRPLRSSPPRTRCRGSMTWLATNEDVDFWSRLFGRNVIRFYLPLAILPPSDHHSQIVVMAKGLDARVKLQGELEDYLTETFPGGSRRVSPLEMGPPIGWPLQWRLSGPDVETLRTHAFALAEVVASNPGADQVHFDWIEPARQLRIESTRTRRGVSGLTSQSCRRAAQAVSGAPVTLDCATGSTWSMSSRAQTAGTAFRSTICPRCRFRCLGGRTVALGPSPPSASNRTASRLASRPDADADCSCRCLEGTLPEAVVRAIRRRIAALNTESADRLCHRGGWHGRDHRRKPGGGFRGGAGDDLPDDHASDDPAPGLPHGRYRRDAAAARNDWRGGCAAAVRPAARFRRDPRHPRADRHDRQERGHPDHPDRRTSAPRASACARPRSRRRRTVSARWS